MQIEKRYTSFFKRDNVLSMENYISEKHEQIVELFQEPRFLFWSTAEPCYDLAASKHS